ncbi:unnamed protein product [Cyclocybe aegerita]|uniref:Uncharacterized protein n=1 Tax=Cyclocybe aegerita TaxID=1973307 RepID=A0A8S0X9C8_CYCAE|nr:unnamed protein product [Cyclocybe aegerita]
MSDEHSKDQPEIPSSSTPARGILRSTGDNASVSPASGFLETPYPALDVKLALEPPKANVPPLVPNPSLISPESEEPEAYVDGASSDTVIDNSSLISNSYNYNGRNAGAENQPIITQTWKDSTSIDSQVVSNSGSGNNFSHLWGPTTDVDFSASAPDAVSLSNAIFLPTRLNNVSSMPTSEFFQPTAA